MAQIFKSVFGDRLVTRYLFDSDLDDDPHLPSPNQLKYKVLIKNKKLIQTSVLHSRFRGSSNSVRTAGSLPGVPGSGGSGEAGITDYDEADDDDDEDEDFAPEVPNAPSQARPRVGSYSFDRATGRSNEERSGASDWQFDESSVYSGPGKAAGAKGKHGKTNQIAKELSDLVVYTQAVKFRGFQLQSSPTAGPRFKKSRKFLSPPMSSAPDFGSPASGSSSPTLQPSTQNRSIFRARSAGDGTPLAHQIVSTNENKTKGLCRRLPTAVIAYTEKQIMRTYPHGLRMDSSNFNPVIFWSFGIQMVALNYQTDDSALSINAAMFEQAGRCGYVLKPAVMWERSHVMYNRFNPWYREFDGIQSTILTVKVISGQYLCLGNTTGSPQVEVELIGIPIDCAKHKTSVVNRNSVNPIWNCTFHFEVAFIDLAFLRFTVYEVGGNHLLAQRVVPVKSLRPGYRHLRLRNQSNMPLEPATLYLYTKHEEDGQYFTTNSQDDTYSEMASEASSMEFGKKRTPTLPKQARLDFAGRRVGKRPMHFIRVYGLNEGQDYTILKIGPESRASDVIVQALTKVNRTDESVEDFVLLHEAADESAAVPKIISAEQNIFQMQESGLLQGRLVIRKRSNDPTSRAFFTTIISQERRSQDSQSPAAHDSVPGSASTAPASSAGDGSDDATWCVCVYNVSPDTHYSVFQTQISAVAKEVVQQALVKARRTDAPSDLVLVEEVPPPGTAAQPNTDSPGPIMRRKGAGAGLFGRGVTRILDDSECVYAVQKNWLGCEKFVLMSRSELQAASGTQDSPSRVPVLRRHSVLASASPWQLLTGKRKSSVPYERPRTFSCPMETVRGKEGLSKQASCPAGRLSSIESTNSNTSRAFNILKTKLPKLKRK